MTKEKNKENRFNVNNFNNSFVNFGTVNNNYYNSQQPERQQCQNNDDFDDAEIIEDDDEDPTADDEDCGANEQDILNERQEIISDIISRFYFEDNELGHYKIGSNKVKVTNTDLKDIFALIFGIDNHYNINLDSMIVDHMWRALTKRTSKQGAPDTVGFSRNSVANILGFFRKEGILKIQKSIEVTLCSVLPDVDSDNSGGFRYQVQKGIDDVIKNGIFPKNADEHIRNCICAVLSAKVPGME